MPRVKRGVTAHRRHKKILKKAKGYYGARSRVFRVAKQAVTKAGQYAYRDRRQRKRQFRALWITRINAQSRANGLTYSRLADLAVHDKEAFSAVVERARTALAA
jgi:large subunit ribosomal protein L20